MLSFLFGKKKKKHSVKKGKGRKPPARLIKLCKKYRIKVTKKVGKKRIYKKVSVLKKQLKQKIKKNKRRSRFGKKNKRRSRFGNYDWAKSEMYGPQYIHHISELKKIIRDNGRENSTMKLYDYYDLLAERGYMYDNSEKLKIIDQFLPKYKNKSLTEIMKL
jgi:hypothetical protein